jgi:hypothetical protein
VSIPSSQSMASYPRSTTDCKSERWADERILDTRPDWDPNTLAGLQCIHHTRQAILEGVCQGAGGETNLTRVSEVTQKPDELPSQFYDWLCDAYHWFTPFDPEAPENQSMINTAFIQQSASAVAENYKRWKAFQVPILTNSLV